MNPSLQVVICFCKMYLYVVIDIVVSFNMGAYVWHTPLYGICINLLLKYVLHACCPHP